MIDSLVVGTKHFLWQNVEQLNYYIDQLLNLRNIKYTLGFSDHDLIKIHKLIEENKEIFLEKWNEYFST